MPSSSSSTAEVTQQQHRPPTPDEEEEEEGTRESSLRNRLKRELAHVSITGFHHHHTDDALSASPSSSSSSSTTSTGVARTAEVIMKELETLRPVSSMPHPATHRSLDAHWSFVFTGVPTIGMRLITLLSRISGFLPFELLDFRDVALCVVDGRTRAKAVVEVTVCGTWDVVLEVCTSLRRPEGEDLEDEKYVEYRAEDGTLLLEHFQGVELNGVEIPTPRSWHTTRTLEITYMDEDIMIARTSGGEPHLLLRNSPLCYTPEEMMTLHDDVEEDGDDVDDEMEECDVDGGNAWTEFFGEAIELYGERIARCLVDRDFGGEERLRKEEAMTMSHGGKKDDEDDEWWRWLGTRGLELGRQWGVGDD